MQFTHLEKITIEALEQNRDLIDFYQELSVGAHLRLTVLESLKTKLGVSKRSQIVPAYRALEEGH
jgi:hypothetical protein